MLRATVSGALAIVLVASLAAPAGAIPPPPTFEDRVADSDLVVVGEITAIAPTAATIKVTRILKGPADLKQVSVVGLKQKTPPGPGPLQMMQQGGAATFRVGETLIWTLKALPAGKDLYGNVCSYWKESADHADDAAVVVEALTDPAKTLKNDKASDRGRLSAAYAFLRNVRPEDMLPQSRIAGDLDGAGPAHVEPDTRGYERLDADLVTRAVKAAIAGLGSIRGLSGEPCAWPGEHGLALKTLQRVVPNVQKLRPERPTPAKQRSREQMIADTRAFRRQWADAVQKWWAEHTEAHRLYVPKPGAGVPKAAPIR